MRSFWKKTSDKQLDLLGVDPEPPASRSNGRHPSGNQDFGIGASRARSQSATAIVLANGQPLMVPIAVLDEDPNNPRTEFPDAELDELADDIRERGILEPIVVHPADTAGRYQVHFGAKRLRAAKRAGLAEVPVVLRNAPSDPYAQVAENQKRHGLTPLDLARFIRSRIDDGESNATVAKRLGIDQTTIAHHLALLDLPPELNAAMQSGRCTSPRTLYELSKLHQRQPDQVRALVSGNADITRASVATLRGGTDVAPTSTTAKRTTSPVELANGACGRLESALDRLKRAGLEGHDVQATAPRCS